MALTDVIFCMQMGMHLDPAPQKEKLSDCGLWEK